VQIATKVTFTWTADKFTRALKTEVNNRIERSLEYLRTAIIKNVSVSGESLGNVSAPGDFPRAASGDIVRRMFVDQDRQNFSGRVGTNSFHGLIMEFGAPAATMRPTKMRAMTIPISNADATRIMAEYRRPGKRGKAIKKGNSNRSLMRRAGIVIIAGKLYLLRSFARRKAIAPRPFLRRTLNEEQNAIMKIMQAPLGKGIAPGAVSVGATFPAGAGGSDFAI
jgi:hypothetical protein